MSIYQARNGKYTYWIVRYNNRLRNIRIVRSFNSSDLASDYYQTLCKTFGPANRKKGYLSFENKFCRCVSIVAINRRNRKNQHSDKVNPIYLMQSKLDNSYFTVSDRYLQNMISKNDGTSVGAPRPFRKGTRGYFLHEGKYRPSLTIDGKRYYFGKFVSKNRAHEEFIKRRNEYYFCNGEAPDVHHKRILEKWESEDNSNEQH